ncbi:MAG: MFS transporter, partial [Chloroflexi bacterium]|nr:MFS transporter [Chloroflexota bacterium]
ALCFLLRIGIFAFIIYFQNTPSILIFALLYGFTFLITAPLTIVFVGNIFGTARLGTISGVINMSHQISGGLGAFVGAFIFDTWGSYDRAFILMLGLAFVAFVASLLVREKPISSLAEQPKTLKSPSV